MTNPSPNRRSSVSSSPNSRQSSFTFHQELSGPLHSHHEFPGEEDPDCAPPCDEAKTKVKRWYSLRKSLKTSSEKLVEMAGTRVKRSNTISVPRASWRSRRTSVATTTPHLYDLPALPACEFYSTLSGGL